jgi:hypothetical protein
MRLLILAAGASLALTACGRNGPSDTTTNADENLTAENIVSNDVTAIDAVTGDAANMAADVNYAPDANDMLANGSNTAAPSASRPRPTATPQSKQPAKPEPATEPAANTSE